MGLFALGVGLTVAGAGTAIALNRQAVGAQEAELEVAKRNEAAAARDREVQRKRRIVAILGAQSAEAAAKGLELSGSVANISIEDAKIAREDSLVDRENTRGRIDTLTRRQRSIRRSFKFNTAATILRAGQDIHQAFDQ
jgi:hypothetical protein